MRLTLNIQQAGAAPLRGFERSRMFKSKEHGARSKEQGARSKEQGAWSKEYGVCSKE